MARKIQIDIEVNGKMQKATVDAKKLNAQLQGVGDGMDDVAKSSRTADRNIKGTAQASSNASKNFSKMQQGMGGLVGAYASLAASLFAVSAAFNFLKSAGELKSLQAGQIAYATSTGVALGSLTKDIIKATDSQIQFKDAAQAAAIGTAAGLNADQLTRLGRAAADASQILGRDVTDSFNRLVRGATKAEPELLDELGIILRLEKASKDYADALGINANELTTFQKQQAVTTDILKQAEEKYGSILDEIGRSPNQYAQLGKAFDDIIIKIKQVVDTVAGPLAKVLQDTPILAIASLGVLLSGPLRALGFSFKGIADAAQDAAVKQREFYQGVRADAILANKSANDFKRDLKGLALVGMNVGAKAGFLTKLSEGGDLSGTEAARFKSAVNAAENNVNRLGIVTKGAFTGMKIHMVREMDEAFMNMNLNLEKTLGKTQIFSLRMKSLFAGIGATVKGIAAGIATSFSMALSAISYAALAFTGYQMYRELTKGPPTEDEQIMAKEAQAAGDLLEKLKSINKEYAKFAASQAKATKSGELKFYENMANFFGATTQDDMAEMTKQLKDLGLAQQQMGQTAQEATIRNTSLFAAIAGGVLLAAGALKTAAGLMPMATPQTALGKGLLYGGGVVLSGIAGGLSGVAADTAAAAAEEKGYLDIKRAQERKENELREAMLERLEIMQDVIAAARESSNIRFKEIENLHSVIEDIINSGGPLTDKQIDNFEEAFNKAKGVTSELFAAARAAEQLNTKISQFVSELVNLSSAQSLLVSLNTQIEQQAKTVDDIRAEGGDDRLQSSELARMKIMRESLNVLVNAELQAEQRALDAQEKKIRLLGDETASERENITLANKRIDLLREQEDILGKIATYEATVSLAAADQKISRSAFLATDEGKNLQKQFDNLAQRLRIVAQDVLHNTEQMALVDKTTDDEAMKTKSMELDIAKQIADQAKKRLDLEKQILDFAKKRDARFIDRNLMEERLRNPFYYIDEDSRRANMELDAFNKRYQAEKDLIKRRGAVAKQAIRAEYAVLQHRLDVSAQAAENAGTFSATSEAGTAALKRELTSTEAMAVAAADAGMQDELEQLEHKKYMLEAQIELTSKLREAVEESAQSMEENFTNAFAAIIDGSANGKQAFKMLAESMLQDISRIIARLLVQQAIMSTMNMLGGLFGAPSGGVPTNVSTLPASGRANFTPGAFDFRYGGMMKKGYSTGGIARGSDAGYLAKLHGTEAVVPLPNGRSIPVEMSGGGAQTNNVSVNVNVNNDGTAETTSEGDSREMGKAIAAAVQREIQTQKRPGGLLSPYGSR